MEIIGSFLGRIKKWVQNLLNIHSAIADAHHAKYTDNEARSAVANEDNPCDFIIIAGGSGIGGAAGYRKHKIGIDPNWTQYIKFDNLTDGGRSQQSFGIIEVNNSMQMSGNYGSITAHRNATPYHEKWFEANQATHIFKLQKIDKLELEGNAIIKNMKNHIHSALSGTKKLVEIDINGAPYYFEVHPTKA